MRFQKSRGGCGACGGSGESRLARPRARFAIAGFRNQVDRYIYLTPTTQIAQGLPVFVTTQADAVLWGGEVSADVDVAHPLTLGGRADLVRGENRTRGQPLPLMPPSRAALEAEWRLGRRRWAEGAYLTLTVERTVRQSRLAPLDLPTGGYTLLHLSTGLVTTWAARVVRVDLRVRNATDVTYRDFLSRYKTFADAPGRSVVLRVAAGL